MVCGAREGRAGLALTKWILAPEWPLREEEEELRVGRGREKALQW